MAPASRPAQAYRGGHAGFEGRFPNRSASAAAKATAWVDCSDPSTRTTTPERKKTGLLLLPAAYVLGFTLIVSLAAAEPAKELFGSHFDPVASWSWLALSMFFLVLAALHLRMLRVNGAVAPTESILSADNP